MIDLTKYMSSMYYASLEEVNGKKANRRNILSCLSLRPQYAIKS